MFKSEQRLLELNSRLSKIIESAGKSVDPTDTTTTLINKASESLNELKASNSDLVATVSVLIDGISGVENINIPIGITKIRERAFYKISKLKSVTIPDSVTSIGNSAFSNSGLTSIAIPDSVTSIGDDVFYNCTGLTSVTILSSAAKFYWSTFSRCSNMEYVTLTDGFNGTRLNLSDSTKYSRETIVSWLNALKDRTGESSYELTIGITNLKKLTEEDKKIASNKNWTLK